MPSPRFRHAIRSLARSPVFAVFAVVSLALALAVNTTLFALVDAVLFPAVPYHDDGRAYAIRYLAGWKTSSTLEERFTAIRDGLHSADAVVPYYLTPVTIERNNTIEDVYAANVPPALFSILGVRPAVGRGFSERDTAADALPVVVISYELWLRLFHEEPLAKHLMLTVGRGNYEVVGVMPRGMHFPARDVWLPPGRIVADSLSKPMGPWPLIRARAGLSRDVVERELAVVVAGLNAAMAPRAPVAVRLASFEAGSARIARLQDAVAYLRRLIGWHGAGSNMMFLFALTVLVIACANVGTMLLARGMARRREIAIRIALGASRGAIVGQVVAECAIIVGAGAALGMLLTSWAVHVLPHFAAPYDASIGDMQPTPSWRVFAFAAVVAGVTLIVASALPAWRAAATDPAEPIKDGAGSTGRIRDRYNPLIIVEVALSTALLMTAVLFVIAVVKLSGFDFSYAAKQLQTADLEVKGRDLPADSAVGPFYDDLTARMRGLSGVRDAATAHQAKPDGGIVLAEEGKSGDHWMNLWQYSVVSSSYLSTLGIPLVDGRDFQPGDSGSETGVVIVDDSAAHRLWPGLASPVGRMVKLGDRASKRPWLRVVGVARSVELLPRSDLELPPEPKVYVLEPHDRERDRQLVVRGDGVGGADGQARLAVAIRHEIESAAPWMRTRQVRRWLQGYDGRRQTSGFLASLFTAFGAFGLLLCAVGLYGVVAYTVSRRMRELATRIALGAQSRDIARTVLHDTAVTALAGIGVGAFIALGATHEFAASMFTVHYELALALVAAEAALLGAAALACLGPIRQATRADPVEILRAS